MLKDLFDWMDQRGRFTHILLVGIGGYLFYAVYHMVGNMEETSGNKTIISFFALCFLFIGGIMVLLGGAALLTGHYSENLGVGKKSPGNEKPDSAGAIQAGSSGESVDDDFEEDQPDGE